MLDVAMSVCGDKKYFEMAEISIPSFLNNNPTAKLHIFTDKPKEIEPRYKCDVYDFNEAVKGIDKNTLFSLNTNKPDDFDNNGVIHSHSYVSLLPIIANKVCSGELILKVDVDSYFLGDICACLEGLEEVDSDLFLIERKRADIMKLYAGLPGVGFCMWRKSGKFVDKYIQEFDGYEQTTILKLHQSQGLKSCELTDWNLHICYPFYQALQNHKELTKKDIDTWIPCYLHVTGEDQPQINKLKQLEYWYG